MLHSLGIGLGGFDGNAYRAKQVDHKAMAGAHPFRQRAR
jgi:hypothetical protein